MLFSKNKELSEKLEKEFTESMKDTVDDFFQALHDRDFKQAEDFKQQMMRLMSNTIYLNR